MTEQKLGPPLLTYEHPAGGGFCLAEARLNSEPTLNALSLEMIDLLDEATARWARDDRVAAVLLTGGGERAFSAGGDIQALYRAMRSNHQAGERVDDYPYDFFEREYRLDYRLHTYPKPIVALGHGVIMGGGLGVFRASDTRVVAENVRIALPEVTIGLFPDAGGTWLLKSLPEAHALFLGMTGSRLNAADAIGSGIGTHVVARASFDELVENLKGLAFSGEPDADRVLIDACVAAAPGAELPAGELDRLTPRLSAAEPLADVVAAVRGLAGTSSWIDRGIDTMEQGCPTTVGIVVEQVRRARELSLADCFRLEMTVATHCADNHDFCEGVRALLIEKDNSPQWQFGDLDSLPERYVESHFIEPWTVNPLHDLEDSA
jgi:enoyl-CoA hydratase/carnithine racemase